jgi:hypothetical protein
MWRILRRMTSLCQDWAGSYPVMSLRQQEPPGRPRSLGLGDDKHSGRMVTKPMLSMVRGITTYLTRAVRCCAVALSLHRLLAGLGRRRYVPSWRG